MAGFCEVFCRALDTAAIYRTPLVLASLIAEIGRGPYLSVQRYAKGKRVVDVLVPVALDRAYSYRVPERLELHPGDIVCVPLGAREATAVVWAENPKPNPRLDNRLKDVEEKLELPPLKGELRSFVDWVGELHAELARHGAAHVPAHGRASWAPSASASACGLPAQLRSA